MTSRTVLLTGAAGYIASHTWLALLEAGYAVIGVDDFSNSSPEVLKRLARLAGAEPVSPRYPCTWAPPVRPGLGRRRGNEAPSSRR